MDSSMEFWGVEVKVGETVKVDPNEDLEGYIHISQVALGEVKKGKAIEPVVLYVKVEDQKIVLGTLVKDEIPQISMDIVLDQQSELSHNSKNASVYFCGYKAFSPEDESDSSDFSDSDEELVPLKEDAQAVKEAAKSGKPAADALTKQVKVTDPTNGKTVDPEKNEDDSDESDSDYSEDEISDDEIDTDALTGSSDEETPAKKVDSDESESEQDATPKTIDSDSDADSDSESEEETPAKKVVTQGKNNKRGIGASSQTPVSAKKAKIGTPEKTGGKKGVHIATPHPTKQGGKFNQNAAKGQTSNSSKSGGSKSGQQNKKSKQGRR
ncbi:unnamed protein product [Vicia faba]|uniref:Nucleoplasmin-like domain-containing protein n=1 Tax=Vicia faba TaxID=3906 RepID=A0AAV1B0F4_VICFA|nr:unnamed protein product [Vicia faba]